MTPTDKQTTEERCLHYWNNYEQTCVRKRHHAGDHVFPMDLAISDMGLEAANAKLADAYRELDRVATAAEKSGHEAPAYAIRWIMKTWLATATYNEPIRTPAEPPVRDTREAAIDAFYNARIASSQIHEQCVEAVDAILLAAARKKER